MGLDDYGMGNSNGGSSDREYKQITRQEFEDCIGRVDNDFEIVMQESNNLGHKKSFTGEYVYRVPIAERDDIEIRIFSTIDKNSNRARDKGDDAIRCVIWDNPTESAIGGRKKTLRIKTFCSNLTRKIKELKNQWDSMTTNCSECGGWMVKREGEYGEFLGCTSYPDCNNTEQL